MLCLFLAPCLVLGRSSCWRIFTRSAGWECGWPCGLANPLGRFLGRLAGLSRPPGRKALFCFFLQVGGRGTNRNEMVVYVLLYLVFGLAFDLCFGVKARAGL